VRVGGAPAPARGTARTSWLRDQRGRLLGAVGVQVQVQQRATRLVFAQCAAIPSKSRYSTAGSVSSVAKVAVASNCLMWGSNQPQSYVDQGVSEVGK
jgi:hypothetical protein